MKRALFALSVLLLAVPALAAPVTLGSWRLAPLPSETGEAPWAHGSYDGPQRNAGYILGIGLGELAGAEYLDAAFTFSPGVPWQEIFSQTAYKHAAVSQGPDGRFLFDNPETGDHYDSSGAGWQQFVLVRRVLADRTKYILLIEDINLFIVGPLSLSDGDYQDHLFFAEELHSPVCRDCEPPPSVPEPSLAIMGCLGCLVAAKRLRSTPRRGVK